MFDGCSIDVRSFPVDAGALPVDVGGLPVDFPWMFGGCLIVGCSMYDR